ncbi:MAG: hypothetical protein DRJ15_08540 [Bacteroidetes bacterium]|nr:MAG: hypothetical protein DRI83_01730 [Bacteroidota bacterium]RLD79825.1 MAG: hypothetical protein DRJ15_08540 [Bacteroidota bacterium]
MIYLLVTGYWLLAAGYWLLAAGCWFVFLYIFAPAIDNQPKKDKYGIRSYLSQDNHSCAAGDEVKAGENRHAYCI